MKKWKWVYIAAFLILCLLPFVGLLVDRESGNSTENRALAAFPSLQQEDGSWNLYYLGELGDYFQEHFAFRNQLVTADAKVEGAIGGISTASGVIKGTDGWLYYKDSLADYQGSDLLSERALFDIAHSLRMMQTYVEEQGVKFLFTIAPNKNSLYGEYMPYYYRQKVSGEKNLTRITEYLEKEEVAYSDLYEAFLARNQVLYHKRDSHWNNQGAAYAAHTLLKELDKEHINYEGAREYESIKDFTGDLDQMLYPSAVTLEEEVYYQPGPEFVYREEVENNFEPQIYTQSLAQGSLVVYRDSFGNALLPFLAEAYGSAYFSRGVPYQVSDLTENQADTVIIERAERFLPDMAANPPVMEAPLYLPEGNEMLLTKEQIRDLQAEPYGLYTKISGLLQVEDLATESRIFLQIGDGMMYEAFPVCTAEREEGFILYLNSQAEINVEEDVRVMMIPGS